MNFKRLVHRIQETNDFLQKNAVKAVNTNLTLRNWLTGFYIVEFEQNGSDRAEYGSKLLENIAENIKIKGLTAPELSRCRQFYKTYPQILGLLTQEFKSLLPTHFLTENIEKSILGSATQELKNEELKYISTITRKVRFRSIYKQRIKEYKMKKSLPITVIKVNGEKFKHITRQLFFTK